MDHAHDVQLMEAGIEVQFTNQNRFYHEMLQSAENLEMIKELADSIVGRPQRVKVVLINAPFQQTSLPNEKPSQNPSKSQLLDRVKSDSNVKKFLDAFQGEITDVKELK